jgi:hypothetical protein
VGPLGNYVKVGGKCQKFPASFATIFVVFITLALFSIWRCFPTSNLDLRQCFFQGRTPMVGENQKRKK